MVRAWIAVILFSLITSSALANQDNKHIIIIPTCLYTHDFDNQVIAKTNQFALIKATDAIVLQLMAAKHKINSASICGGFIDVTQNWQQFITQKDHASANFFLKRSTEISSLKQINFEIKYQKEVNELLKQIRPETMWKHLTTFSNFPDRYANSNTGIDAANWLKTSVETIAKTTHHADVNVYTILTGYYQQPSVVAKIGTGTTDGIVISAHMDTLSNRYENKPGADDDGSGSMTILETLRTLLASGMKFKHPIYFIWYAAEEEGLVGSGFVVSAFKKQQIPVKAVIHFDMTGFAYKNDPTIWLMTDYVNKDLTAFLAKLIETYVKQPVKYTTCGYACSDHATWTHNGYAAGLAAEAAFEHTNPVMHSSRDTMDKLSLNHMSDYVKLATAFAVETAEVE